jgi:hypothetical protein
VVRASTQVGWIVGPRNCFPPSRCGGETGIAISLPLRAGARSRLSAACWLTRQHVSIYHRGSTRRAPPYHTSGAFPPPLLYCCGGQLGNSLFARDGFLRVSARVLNVAESTMRGAFGLILRLRREIQSRSGEPYRYTHYILDWWCARRTARCTLIGRLCSSA